METILFVIFACILLLSRDKNLHLENLALRQQLAIMKQKNKRPKIRLRDRDSIYSEYFQSRIQNMGINEVKTAPQSPWQNPYVERLIDSIRRDCINAMIILNEDHLRHILTEYLAYYHEDRTHLGLGKETPADRLVSKKQGNAKVIALPRLGGLHHRYEWQDAA